ncbi:hypothetical protein PGTUg99_000198 [Puccinia graminis f. sp. tritici]|uniref:Uncharacterized protein n=1 Tax=Puccinia graminis f. sp. tritici TaxID=56615 RepID=A0A5B0RVE3_PUCGR|nr:hypothetical protein PGTUg99_000198 [Puccinia graminis f. sp. tritici]
MFDICDMLLTLDRCLCKLPNWMFQTIQSPIELPHCGSYAAFPRLSGNYAHEFVKLTIVVGFKIEKAREEKKIQRADEGTLMCSKFRMTRIRHSFQKGTNRIFKSRVLQTNLKRDTVGIERRLTEFLETRRRSMRLKQHAGMEVLLSRRPPEIA